MATTIIVATIAALCSKHNITREQLSAGTHIVENGTQHAVIVESASVPGQEYKVIWNAQYKVLQCTAHNGEACKASASGKQCYHKRVALAVLELEKIEARREQAEVEVSDEYKFEQAIVAFDEAMRRFDEATSEFNEIMQDAQERGVFSF